MIHDVTVCVWGVPRDAIPKAISHSRRMSRRTYGTVLTGGEAT